MVGDASSLGQQREVLRRVRAYLGGADGRGSAAAAAAAARLLGYLRRWMWDSALGALLRAVVAAAARSGGWAGGGSPQQQQQQQQQQRARDLQLLFAATGGAGAVAHGDRRLPWIREKPPRGAAQ